MISDFEFAATKNGDQGLLKQTSFIIHYLFWQGAARSANVRVADDSDEGPTVDFQEPVYERQRPSMKTLVKPTFPTAPCFLLTSQQDTPPHPRYRGPLGHPSIRARTETGTLYDRTRGSLTFIKGPYCPGRYEGSRGHPSGCQPEIRFQRCS